MNSNARLAAAAIGLAFLGSYLSSVAWENRWETFSDALLALEYGVAIAIGLAIVWFILSELGRILGTRVLRKVLPRDASRTTKNKSHAREISGFQDED